MFSLSEAHLLQHISGQPQQSGPQVAKRAQANAHIQSIEQQDEARLRKQLRTREMNRRNDTRKNGYLEQSNNLAAEIIARLNPEQALAAKSRVAAAGGSEDDEFDDFDFDDL